MSERELFEEWAYKNKWNIFRVRDMGLDEYVDDFVNAAWVGWQASANRKGYKLVPVEIETLQNRIDESLDFLHASNHYNEYYVSQAIKILKGE